ncbi:MAG: class I SAM-dependent RNA methyltransferase [Bacteroidota bacterium]
MWYFTNSSRIFITCNKRLSPYLKKEVESLGYEVPDMLSTGVWLNGTMKDCIKLNLNLRTGSLVMYSLKQFTCDSPEELYAAAQQIAWEKIIPEDGYFSVSSNVYHPSISTDLFANVKIKDAIVDRLREKTGKRPDTGPLLDQTVIYLFWKDDKAELFIDTSGETLAKHGYRKIPGKAPMLEALAAATLLATKWNHQSPFINPMCGSGTLAIEAAMLATKRAPGLYRNNYAFMHLIGYEEAMFIVEKDLITGQVTERNDLTIVATDISEDAINISKINAGIAGVEKYIQFSVCDFAETPIPETSGVVMFNPEYGERLGEEAALEAIYSSIGDFMKKQCKGYTGYVFTGNLDLAKKIGLKAARRIEFYTGKIDCRLLEYELYAGSKR